MKNEVLAYINLKEFKDYLEVEMEGSGEQLLSLTAALIDELSEEMGEDPHKVLWEVNSRVTQARTLRMLKGGRP